MQRVRPDGKQYRAFEDEAIRMGRPAESVEQALDAVADEDEIERLLALLAEREEPLPHGGGQIPFRRGAHVRLSR